MNAEKDIEALTGVAQGGDANDQPPRNTPLLAIAQFFAPKSNLPWLCSLLAVVAALTCAPHLAPAAVTALSGALLHLVAQRRQ